MMAMSNEQLTTELTNMNAKLAVVEQKLEMIIPEISSKATEAKDTADELLQKLKEHLNPLIEAGVLTSLVSLPDKHTELANHVEALRKAT